MKTATNIILITLSAASVHAATTVNFGPLTDDSASIDTSGYGSTASSDYLGIVTSTAPLQIDAGATTVSSGLSPTVGDVIGRDLVSTGIDYTGSTISWTVGLPPVPADYVASTFDVTAAFNSDLAFGGNAFSGTQPNALDFTLSFDASSQDTFQGQSGTHTAASLAGSQVDGAPVSSVTVTVTFPNGNAFNAGTEEFRIFTDSLVVSGSYDVNPVPEPSSALLGSFALLGLLRRRR